MAILGKYHRNTFFSYIEISLHLIKKPQNFCFVQLNTPGKILLVFSRTEVMCNVFLHRKEFNPANTCSSPPLVDPIKMPFFFRFRIKANKLPSDISVVRRNEMYSIPTNPSGHNWEFAASYRWFLHSDQGTKRMKMELVLPSRYASWKSLILRLLGVKSLHRCHCKVVCCIIMILLLINTVSR